MFSMGIVEPPSELPRVVDPLTNGTIVCANRTHCRNANWIAQFVVNNSNNSGLNPTLIDVTNHFIHDSFIDRNRIPEFSKMLVQYCCEMHRALVATGYVVVFCRNGRSRSPCVILAFYLCKFCSYMRRSIKWLNINRQFKQIYNEFKMAFISV